MPAIELLAKVGDERPEHAQNSIMLFGALELEVGHRGHAGAFGYDGLDGQGLDGLFERF